MHERPGRFSNDLSLISAPLLSVWNVIPLVYFLECHVLMRAWGRQLASAIRRNYRIPARLHRRDGGGGFPASPQVESSVRAWE